MQLEDFDHEQLEFSFQAPEPQEETQEPPTSSDLTQSTISDPSPPYSVGTPTSPFPPEVDETVGEDASSCRVEPPTPRTPISPPPLPRPEEQLKDSDDEPSTPNPAPSDIEEEDEPEGLESWVLVDPKDQC